MLQAARSMGEANLVFKWVSDKAFSPDSCSVVRAASSLVYLLAPTSICSSGIAGLVVCPTAHHCGSPPSPQFIGTSDHFAPRAPCSHGAKLDGDLDIYIQQSYKKQILLLKDPPAYTKSFLKAREGVRGIGS